MKKYVLLAIILVANVFRFELLVAIEYSNKYQKEEPVRCLILPRADGKFEFSGCSKEQVDSFLKQV